MFDESDIEKKDFSSRGNDVRSGNKRHYDEIAHEHSRSSCSGVDET